MNAVEFEAAMGPLFGDSAESDDIEFGGSICCAAFLTIPLWPSTGSWSTRSV